MTENNTSKLNRSSACPLCGSLVQPAINTIDLRRYYCCKKCYLIHLDRRQLPTAEQERKRYQHHQNSLADEGYVRFLMKAVSPSLPYLRPGMKVLDFGCGPRPVLSHLLRRDYHTPCDYYDPFFYPYLPPLHYDFIFSTETFEHFFFPAASLDKLYALLNPKAYLCVMTQCWDSLEHFEDWWYRRDSTHVCFYHANTIDFISQKWSLKPVYGDKKGVFILQKP